jgi:hypothetical protein
VDNDYLFVNADGITLIATRSLCDTVRERRVNREHFDEVVEVYHNAVVDGKPCRGMTLAMVRAFDAAKADQGADPRVMAEIRSVFKLVTLETTQGDRQVRDAADKRAHAHIEPEVFKCFERAANEGDAAGMAIAYNVLSELAAERPNSRLRARLPALLKRLDEAQAAG